MRKFLAVAWFCLVAISFIGLMALTLFQAGGWKIILAFLGLIAVVAISVWAGSVLDES